MGKAAARKRTTAKNSDPALDYLSAFDARSQLIATSLSIGWRLGMMVLIPLFIGVQLDKKFDSSPSLTLAAFFIAIFGSGVLISKTYKEINAAQAAKSAKKSRRIKTVKRNTDV